MKIVPTFAAEDITGGQWHLMHLAKADAAKAAKVASGQAGKREVRYVTNPTPGEARAALDPNDPRPLVLDIETVMDTGEITMCGVSRVYGHVLALPWREPYTTLLRLALQGPATKVAHNAGFDMPRLAQALGLDRVAGPWFDTLEAHALCYGDLPHNLESVASMWYDRHPWKASYRTERAISQEMYNCMDVDATMAAYDGLTATMEELGVRGVFDTITMPAVPIMIHMHETGIRLDGKRVAEAKTYFEERATLAQEAMDDFVAAMPSRIKARDLLMVEADRLDEEAEALWVPGTKREAGKLRTKAKRMRERAASLGGVNASSPKQLKELFEELGLPSRGSTDEDSIVSLLALTRGTGRSKVGKHVVPLLKAILEYRKTSKVVSTYLSYGCDHLHPRFLLWGTGTGRLSSREPNIQNIPHRDGDAWRIRRCFVPPVEGWVFSEVDYSQLERRIQAIIWDDKPLQEAYAAGLDTHTATAARMFNVAYDAVTKDQRNYAKTAVYGQSYGMGPDKYRRDQARHGNYISMAEAKEFLAAVATAHPGVAAGQKRAIARAQQTQMLRNNFGRIRWFLGPDVYGDAMNFLPQSNAADIMLTAMVTLWNQRPSLPPFVIVAQIHDSLLLAHDPKDGPVVRAAAKAAMEQPFDQFNGATFPTDAKCDGKDWSFGEE